MTAGWMALGLIVLAGCSHQDPAKGPQNPGGSSASAPRPTESELAPAADRSHDPVTAFDDEHIILPDGAVALDAGTAWVSAWEGLVAIEIATEKTVVSKLNGQRATKQPERGSPVVADVGGTRLVTTVAALEIAGSGTQRTQFAIELIAADAATKEKAWSTKIPLEEAFAENVDLKIWAVDRGIAVIGYGSSLWAVDLATRKTLWDKPNISNVITVGDGAIVVSSSTGSGDQQLLGLSVLTGQQVWNKDFKTGLLESSPTFIAAGPRHLLIVRGEDLAVSRMEFVETRTGRQVTETGVTVAPDACSHDRAETIVCGKYKYGSYGMFALDAKTGEKLWSLPTNDRDAPRFTSAWHGVVYGGLRGKALMLDARTGKDRPGTLQESPDLVDGLAGIFIDLGNLGRADERRATARVTTG
ncbi:PQQ-binding-like beta-propeller repeat protein [Streptomyces gardneri]|uniref:outer membrane protein assembly factor BamB family protein n=1 Tax=Streptomyces gardneri TaxID=66892 RepID=UPI0036B39497